jgi:hypothetical protein
MKILQVIASTATESGGPIENALRNSNVWVRDGHSAGVASLDDEAALLAGAFLCRWRRLADASYIE